MLLWVWPGAAALIRLLAWKLPYVAGEALKKQKKKKDLCQLNDGSLLCLDFLWIAIHAFPQQILIVMGSSGCWRVQSS